MQKPRKRKFMNYYLIDYENTGETGLNGIDKLDENSLDVNFLQCKQQGCISILKCTKNLWRPKHG